MPDAADRLSLVILDVAFDIRCEDADLRHLIARLWDPFVHADNPSGSRIEITCSGRDWSMSGGGEGRALFDDAWVLLNELRRRLVSESIMRSRSSVVLHAAAVTFGDRAIVLPGLPGAGKTSLTLGLLAEGASYLTDDVCVVRPDSRLRAFPKPLSLKEPARWPEFEHAFGSLTVPPPQTIFFIPPRLFTVGHAHCPIVALGFPNFSPLSEPELDLLTAGQATLRCAQHSAVGVTPDALDQFARICQGVPVAELRYGATRDGVDLIKKLVAAG